MPELTAEQILAAARQKGRDARLAAQTARSDAETSLKENDPDLQKAGVGNAADAFGLNLIDKGSLGLLPFVHDKLVDWAGEERMGPRYRDIMGKVAEAHPKSSFVGSAAGTMLPFAGAARAAQVGLGAGKLAAGAIGAGGADAADQAVRTVTEGREFDPNQVGVSALIGGAGPMAGSLLAHPIKAAGGALLQKAAPALAERLLGKTTSALEQQLPNVADDAARAASGVFDDAAAARLAAGKGRSGLGTLERPRPAERAGPAMEPPGPLKAPGPKPMEDLSTYAADDPLAEVARMSRASGVPHFDQPGAMPPPRTPGPIEGMEPFGPKPLPFQGVRPSKLEPGSPMYEQLTRRIRGEPPPPPAPEPAPPPPAEKPPGLLSLPYFKLGAAAGANTAIEQPRKMKKRRRY